MYRIVLAINGKQWHTTPARFRSDQFSGGNQTFLVRQAESLARANRFISCFQPSNANDRAHHKIHFGMSRDPNRSSRAVNHLDFC